MENVEVHSVKVSQEGQFVIVIIKNSTRSDQHSVLRYSQDDSSNWVKAEHLFDSNGASSGVFYDSVDVFNDYAVGYRDNKFYVLYYKDRVGDLLPYNFEVVAYEAQVERGSENPVYSFYDTSGYFGEWQLIVIIKWPGATQVVPVTMAISPSSRSATFTE